MKKRFISWLLVLTMIVSMLPSTMITASAADVPTVQAASDGVTIGDVLTEHTLKTSDTTPYTISATGTYRVTGQSSQPIIITADASEVILVLNDVEIRSATSPIQLQAGEWGAAAKVTLVIPDGKTNTLLCTTTDAVTAAGETVQGKTAGINVPEGTTLTIDKVAGEEGTGTLTVTAGYGGAGIGGNMGYGYSTEKAPKGADGSAAQDTAVAYPVSTKYGYYNRKGTEGALGGDGGYNGRNAESSGEVSICGGVVTVTGGSGAAGIGGGMGGIGEAGQDGKSGEKGAIGDFVTDGVYVMSHHGGAGGAGGQGGTGGAGGQGGTGGAVSISGGTVRVTGGTNAVGIGGGSGGIGGAGGAGGNGGNGGANVYINHSSRDFVSKCGLGGYGAAGGFGGNGGNGGAAGMLTITGGAVSISGAAATGGGSVGETGSDGARGTDGVKGTHCGSYTEGYASQASRAVWPTNPSQPGSVNSIERPENTSVAGAAAEVEINESNANIDFTNTAGTFTRPKDKNGVELYKTTFTVRDKATGTLVPGAEISIQVSGDTIYNYKTVADDAGKGIVWLPVGSYPISGTVIQKAGIGSLTSESATTLVVTEDDSRELTVYIGGGIKLSLSNEEKTYEAIKVNADVTDVQGVIQSVQWFREKINGNNQQYDKLENAATGVKTFDTGYGTAGTGDKGDAVATADNEKLYAINAEQNGRYWVRVKYINGGREESIIMSIEVTNIYRKFPIQVNSYVLDKGKKQNETGYQALQLADGTAFTGSYGFAWDLNGYNADALDGTKLLSADVAPYDTVSIAALSTRFTWYNAKIDNSNKEFTASGSGGYAAIELTLNPDFLDTNKNLDCDGKDVSKYTIVYTPKAGALTVVEVSGVDKAATDGTTLYSNPRTYTDAITEDTLVAQKLKGYKLTGVKIITADGTERDGTLITEQDGSYAVKIENIQGTVDNEYNDTIAGVRFIYEDNMTNVKILAHYKDTTTKVEGFTEYTVPMEIGSTVTYAPPQIENHNSVGSSLAEDGTYTVAEGGEIIFYYVKATGNVTYKAVLDGTDKVLWTKIGKVANGAAPETESDATLPSDAEAAGFSLLYERKAGDQAQLSSATYDGVNDIEVTYTYVNKQVEITVRQIDVATMQPVTGTAEVKEKKNVGEAATVTAPATPEGYTLLGGAQQLVNVPTDGTPVVVDFYYKASEQATITIKLYGSPEDKTAGNAFNVLTLTGYYGVKQTVTAPTVLGWKLADGEQQTIDVTPTKGDDTSLVAEFVYEPVYVTVTVEYREKVTDLKLDSQTYEVQQGQGLSVVAPYVKGYKLAEGEAAAWNPTAKELETTRNYIFKYSKLDADDLVKITVKGVGPNNVQLYSYEKLVPVGAPDQQIAAFTQPKLALVSATVDGVYAAIKESKEVDVSLENKAAKDEIAVVFTYKSNVAKVTINAKLNEDKTTPVPGYTVIEVNAEIGDVLTYTAPAIEGYVYVGRTHEAGLTVTGVPAQDVIDFYYEAAPVMGNVTYVAVDKDDPSHILAYGKGVQLVKGEIVDVDTAKGINHFFSAGVTNWEWTNEAPTVDGADADGKYDGKTNVTVTFKFQRGTKAININLMDADTGEKITVAGKTYSQIVSKGVETEITAPADVPGYTAIPNQTVKITAADNAVDETVTFFYRKNDNSASVTVQLCYIDPETNTEKLFNSYTIPGVLGTTRTVTAPDLSGQGFSSPDKAEASVTFEANTPAVKFVYQTVAHKTITVELKSGADDLTAQVTGLKTRYVLRMGETLTVNAPSIYGYALEEKQAQVISKSYDDLTDNEVITINYKKVEVDFVKITVIGKVEGVANNLYSYETSVAVDAGSAELNVYDWPQYKVKDGKAALIGGAAGDTELTVANDKVTVNFNDADRNLTVTVTYVKNTARVTVKAHLFVNNVQTNEPVEGFDDITFEAVIGEDATYTPPSLPGYAYKGSSMTDNKITVSETEANNTIIFYYAKSQGQVTYKAVDQGGNDLGYSYSEPLAPDTVIVTDGKAPTVPNYRLDDTAQVKVEGATADNKFDGSNPVTVTYTFKKFTKTVKIILVDDATHTKITEVDSDPYEAGAAVAIPAPDISTIAAMNGYRRVSADSQERFIMDNDHPQSVTFYYAREDEERPKVTVNLKDEKDNLIHSYIVIGDWGVDMKIAVPDLSGQGYKYANDGEDTVIVTPEEGNDVSLVKNLKYNTQYWTITVKISPDGASNLLPESDYARSYKVRRNSSFTLTAPSIAGYTLTSGNLNKGWDKVTADETVEFGYDLADAVTNSVHTIVGKTNDGKQLYKFTQTVTKNAGKTTYTATPIDGYTVNQETVELSNDSNQNFGFIYTDNAATVTVIPVDEHGTEIPDASVTYSGYQKGQQGVKVRAPHVDGKVLVGPWNEATGAVDGTNLIQTINLSATERNNVVKFAYKDPTTIYTFTLYCAEHPGVVIRVIEGSAGEWSVAPGGKLDLTADGFVFDWQNADNSDQFKTENASLTIAEGAESASYDLYYNHVKQDLEYKFVDGEGNEIPGTDTVKNDNPVKWDVNENLVVAAPEIPGYTATQLRQSLTVVKQADGAKQTITFQYTKKATGTITVEHKLDDALTPFSSYTVSVSDGEWFTANALTDAKYALVGESTQTIQANSGESKTITFVYNKNFVTVNTFTNLGTSDEPYESDIEVTKGQNAVLTPPARSRFVLKGIKVVIGTQTLGGENELNVTSYANDKLTLTNLTEDARVYYYYKPISDVVTENQVTITVVEKYEAYNLGGATYKETKTESDDLSAPYPYGTYDGFKLIGYEIDGVEKDLPETFAGASVDHKTDHTITYRYGLADGSNNVVVPGPDGKLPSGDDVTIKPTDPDEKPGVGEDGTVTVPDGGGTVTTPDGTVDVPGGSKVDEKGSITDPDGNPIKPGAPAETDKYYFVQYKANGGVGESHTEYYAKADGSVTLKTVGELFTYAGYNENGWNTYANGKGDPYTAAAEVTGKNLTLYAQWTKSAEPTGQYKATIVLKPNGAEAGDVTQTIASNDNNPIRENIQANPFSIEGWTFKGWLTAKTDDSDATYYADQAVAEVANGDTLTLYAQWIKVGDDGSITVPGQDNKPGTEDDVTAKPGEGGQLDRKDDGTITVPSGGSAVTKDGEIDMPNGGTVKPDGTITVKQPDGSDIEIKPGEKPKDPTNPDKTVYTLTYKSGVNDVPDKKVYFTTSVTVAADALTREGYKLGQWLKGADPVAVGTVYNSADPNFEGSVVLTAKWYKVGDNGEITVPGKDGDIEAPADNVTVNPKPGETDPDKQPKVDDNGKVTVPDGGSVTTPDGEVVVPGGSKVDPDGTITDSDGKKLYPTEAGDPETPEGYFKVTYKAGDSGIAGQKDVVQLVKTGTQVVVMGNPFASANKVFIGWKDGQGNVVELTTQLNAETTLTAQWKVEGSVVLEWAKGSKVQDGAVDGEYKLIMRGQWATTDSDKTDKTYTIPVLVDGQVTADGLRWYVDADSYKNDFGFTNSVLDGNDIVTVNATTGEITVKNSGIVRIWCESTADPTVKISVVIIVAGDVTQDGYVDLDDATWLYDAVDALQDGRDSFPTVDPYNAATWYLRDLANLSDSSDDIDYDDATAIFDLAEELVKI